jgi:hypothetical protein
MFSQAGYFPAKPAPADLLPNGISSSYPHVALFADKFCNEQNMRAMLEWSEKLALCDDILTVRYNGVDYRAFCFAERYHATIMCGGFDSLHDYAGHGRVIRLTC